jgi:hypothetical protein
MTRFFGGIPGARAPEAGLAAGAAGSDDGSCAPAIGTNPPALMTSVASAQVDAQRFKNE